MKSICIIMAHFEEEESVSDKELNESTSSIGKENSQEEIENNARIDEEQKEKLVKLPLGRIKTIIKMDPEVHMVNQEAVFLITKSTLLGSSMFGLCMWLRLDPNFQEWVNFLEIYEFYIGIYILLAASIFIVVITFIGCGVALMEHILGLYIYAGLQLFSYVLGLVGTAILLDYSTYDSKIQPLIRRSMRALINNYQDPKATYILQLIQESIGCCGADGPMDYLTLKKPLPTECRNTVTGNAFFYGCVEEISWFLEGRSGWLAGLALALCMLHIIITALTLTLVRAIKKEEQYITYKR